MRNVLLILAFMGMVLAFVPCSAAQSSVALEVSVTKYEPYPAVPGNYVDVWISVKNVGMAAAPDAELEVLEAFPFSKLEGYEYTWHVGRLSPGESAVKMFRLAVDRNAVAGANKLKVKYTSDTSSDVWVVKELDVEVQPYQSFISIEEVKVNGTPYPGTTSELVLKVKNGASAYLKNVRLTLSPLVEENARIVPLGASTKVIDVMAPLEEKELVFSLAIDSGTKAGVYVLPLSISYYDEAGTIYTQNENVGVVVNGKPQLKVVVESSNDYVVRGRINDLRVSVINTGTVDAEFVEVRVGNSEDFVVLGESEKYIGSVESDDKETFVVNSYVYPNAHKNMVVPIHLEYMDVMGSKYVEDRNVVVKTYSMEELGKYGATNETHSKYRYLVIFLLVRYFAWRKGWLTKKKRK